MRTGPAADADPGSGSGLGFRIVAALARQIGACFGSERHGGPGARFWISLWPDCAPPSLAWP